MVREKEGGEKPRDGANAPPQSGEEEKGKLRVVEVFTQLI